MKRLAIAGLALWLSAAAWAQTGKITGVVSDAITGEALIQASVLVNGTGVATDFDGAYTLDLPTGPTTSPSNTSATRAKPAPSPWTVRSCRPTSS